MREKINCRDEEAIMDGIRSGSTSRSEAAIACLYRKAYQHPLQNFIRKKGGSRADFEDLYQEVMIVVVKNITNGRYEHDEKLGGYIFGVGRNIWMEKRRKLAHFQELKPNFPDTAGGLSEGQRERFVLVHRCLEQLGEPCSTILQRRWIDGDNLRNIAEGLGYTYGSMRHKYLSCWKKLEECCHRSKDKRTSP